MKKKILGIILCVAVLASIGIETAVGAFAYDTTISDWGLEYFNKLDTGIYWFTEKDEVIPTKDYTINKDAPTVIYTHGWKPSGESRFREGLSLKSAVPGAFSDQGLEPYEYDPEFYNYYIEKGYNIGVYYWNQLADNEGKSGAFSPDFSVDKKIWIANEGKNMRYTTFQTENAKEGKITTSKDSTNPKESIAIMYAKDIINALGNDFNGSLQLVGHSMGGQLTLATSEYLCLQYDDGKIGENLLPDRVTLLDPYFEAFTGICETVTVDSTGKTYEYDAKENNPIYTAMFVADATDTIRKHSIPIEGYIANADMVVKNYETLLTVNKKEEISKPITEKLKNNCVWVHAKTISRFGGFSPTHVMAVDYYFTSNNMKVKKSAEGYNVPCATMPTEELYELIGLCFEQTTSNDKNPMYYSDGEFKLVDFTTMEAYEEGEFTGRIVGKINVVNRNGKEVVAKLIDTEKNIVAESFVDAKGNYYFNEIADGDYQISIYADDFKAGEIESCVVNKEASLFTEADEIEITMGGDKILFYVLLLIVGVLVIVVCVKLVNLIAKSARNHKNAK